MNVKNALILLLIVIIACILIFNDTTPAPVAYETYIVKPGDTVCDISIKKTGPKFDYRMTEHYILKINDIKNACILPGDTIFVPVWE